MAPPSQELRPGQVLRCLTWPFLFGNPPIAGCRARLERLGEVAFPAAARRRQRSPYRRLPPRRPGRSGDLRADACATGSGWTDSARDPDDRARAAHQRGDVGVGAVRAAVVREAAFRELVRRPAGTAADPAP